MIDWFELRVRMQLWLHRAWPFRVLSWWRERGPLQETGFGAFRANAERNGLAGIAIPSAVDLDALKADAKTSVTTAALRQRLRPLINQEKPMTAAADLARAFIADAERLDNSPLTQIDAAINAIAALDPRALDDECIQLYLRIKYERSLDALEIFACRATAMHIAKQLLSNVESKDDEHG